jgi:serine/threonine-protein kinase PRP4
MDVTEPKESEEEYQRRVEEQMRMIQEQTKPVDEEEEIRRRRERRKLLMQKIGQQPPVKTEEQPSVQQQTPAQAPQPKQEPSDAVKVKEEPEKASEVVKEAKLEKTHENGHATSAEHSHGHPSKLKSVDNEVALDPVHDYSQAFDMFSQSPDADGLTALNERKTGPTLSDVAHAAANISEVMDDAEGYYCYRMGEVLNGKYSVLGGFGKGVFSTVIRAKDLANPTEREVAIKVLRNNEAMYVLYCNVVADVLLALSLLTWLLVLVVGSAWV